MKRIVGKRLFGVVLLTVGFALDASLAFASSTATITIGGSEQQIGSTWDASEITISFNGFSETVSYGQYSSAASVASAFGALFTRDYYNDGLGAQATGSTITFKLTAGTFGPISASDPNTSFTVGTSGWSAGGGPPAPPPPPASSCQGALNRGTFQILPKLHLELRSRTNSDLDGQAVAQVQSQPNMPASMNKIFSSDAAKKVDEDFVI